MSEINELIEKIGGRDRLLEIIVTGPDASGAEQNLMARALLAVLDAKQSPVWGQARFKGDEWSSCSAEHAAIVMANPEEWDDYECRYLYTIPQAASNVKLPTTRLWAGAIECYAKDDVISVLRSAGIEVSDD